MDGIPVSRYWFPLRNTFCSYCTQGAEVDVEDKYICHRSSICGDEQGGSLTGIRLD